MKKWDSACARQHSFSKENQRPFLSSAVVQRIGLPFLIVFCSSTYLITGAVGYGDGPYYADEISMRLLVEPGHLLWRPFGAGIFSIASFFGYQGDVLSILQAVSFLGSVGSVLATYFFLSRWASHVTSLWGSAVIGFSNGFLFYSLSGSSYTIGLLFTLLALIFVTAERHYRHSILRIILAALFSGVAALFWLVYGLIFPVVLGLIAISTKLELGTNKAAIIRHLGLFLIGYGVTVGLPLVGCYLLLPVLDPYVVKETPFEPEGFFGWLASATHGIRSHFGILQVPRWIFGLAQSFVAFGGLGQSIRLTIVDGLEINWGSLILGSILLLSFYGLLGICLFKLWRNWQGALAAGAKSVLIMGACSFILNSLFALSWDATALERYWLSLPFLVLTFCLAVDLERIVLHRAAVMVLSLSVLIMVNWYTTVYPTVDATSYQNQWLKAIGRHLKKEDLLIVLGLNKFKIVDPHNRNMPQIRNVSLLPSPQEYKAIILNDIQEARKRGGHIFIGGSVFGLDPRPRDGWSFREHPEPSPKDLDDFFAPMKGELAFSVDSERVWMAR